MIYSSLAGSFYVWWVFCLVILFCLFVCFLFFENYWLAFIGQSATEFVFKNMLTFLFYFYHGHLGNLFRSSVLSCQCLKKLEIKEDVKIIQVKTNMNPAREAFSHHLTCYVRSNIGLFMYHILFCLHSWFPIFRKVRRNGIYLRIVHGRDCWTFSSFRVPVSPSFHQTCGIYIVR